jgi:hypothetical protein
MLQDVLGERLSRRAAAVWSRAGQCTGPAAESQSNGALEDVERSHQPERQRIVLLASEHPRHAASYPARVVDLEAECRHAASSRKVPEFRWVCLLPAATNTRCLLVTRRSSRRRAASVGARQRTDDRFSGRKSSSGSRKVWFSSAAAYGRARHQSDRYSGLKENWRKPTGCAGVARVSSEMNSWGQYRQPSATEVQGPDPHAQGDIIRRPGGQELKRK